MRLGEMTDSELRAELARVGEGTNRYDEIMAELEERTMIRRAHPKRVGWHSATDIREGK